MREESAELKAEGLRLCAAIQCGLEHFINRHGYASLTRGTILLFSCMYRCGQNPDCSRKPLFGASAMHGCVCVFGERGVSL